MRHLAGLTLLLAHGLALAASMPLAVRGERVVLIRNEGPTLTVKLLKRDLNIYENADTLHGLLYDPQRRLVATLDIPDDGNAGKGGGMGAPQEAEAIVADAVPGVYRLQLASNGDQIFGLQTSGAGCVTSGDILLNDGSLAGQVLFMPPADKFKITAQALHPPGQQQMPLLDAAGNVVKTFDMAKAGVDDVLEVPAGERGGLWRLDIAHMDVKIVCDKPLFWAFSQDDWFDALRTRWMLLPYRQTRYVLPGQKARLGLDLRNGSGAAQRFRVQVQAPAELIVTQPASPVAVEMGGLSRLSFEVAVKPGTKPGSVLSGTARAVAEGDPSLGESVGFEIRVSPSPLGRKLDLPIALRPYEHEIMQFGYAPDFEPNEVYFDPQNRPFMRQRTENRYLSTGVQVLEGGRWIERSFMEAIKAAYPTYKGMYGASGFLGAKVAFDAEGWIYTMLRISIEGSSQILLLSSPDAGRTWQICPIPGAAFDIEQFTGHNALSQPPPVLSYVFTKPHPATFAGYHDLMLYVPQKQGGKLVLGEPIKVAENCVGSCQHSGGPASTATRDGKTHIVWGEIAPDDAPGVPEYVATYDHATGKVGAKVLLGHGPPVNDVHNVPAVCQDSRGFIHVIVGSHGEAFQYARSLKPNDAYGGWTKTEPVLAGGYVDDKTDADGSGRQTYCSLVCGPDDALYIAYRQWRRNVDRFHPNQIYAALSVQRKPPDGPWGPAQPIVVPPVPGYSIYYHKLTVDRKGRLYLSYNHWTNHGYQQEWPELYHNRAMVTSADGGKTWKLVTTEDFVAGMK
jgi:hypothetical protein